jgi:GNAT superfamily N-acetyltransferase
VTLRRGGPEDRALVLSLFDANVAWLAARGREGQWGSSPWTGDPAREGFVDDLLAGGETLVAGDGEGVLVLAAEAPAWVAAAGEPERYVLLLVAHPAQRGSGVGAALLEHARSRTREAGVSLLRLDCWAGGDGRLVAYYEGQGFRRTTTFSSGGFDGQVLEQRL